MPMLYFLIWVDCRRESVPELDLALNTGIRKGSQYGLTWDRIDWKGQMLNIPRTKNEEPLHFPLNDAAIAALKVGHARGE